MTDAAVKRMTADAFLLWNLDQPERWELVDGVPIKKFDNGPGMMAGASERHDQIVVNVISGLRARLRGGPCRVKSADQAARMSRGNIRFPDVTVDCGARRPGSFESVEPTVVFEVLSPSTRRFDLLRKADEYRALPSLKHVVLLETERAEALVWTRDDGGDWPPPETVEGLTGAVALAGVGVSLPMAEVYEDVELGGG